MKDYCKLIYIFKGISSLFVMTMQSFYVTESLPSTPYVKAVDIFTGISITFIFAAFIETIYVHICYSQSGGKTTYSNASDIEAEKVILYKYSIKVFEALL